MSLLIIGGPVNVLRTPANQRMSSTTAKPTTKYKTFSFGGCVPTKAKITPPIIAKTATNLDAPPKLNGPLCVHVLPSANNHAAMGETYEMYNNTAEPVAKTK